ncbi:MAG: hypothetical protein PHF42_08275 [Pseudomonas sp.]|jgi:hypothetical protein|nr:hypothetical protein [Pseudomonas sp.]MDY0414542.1 hypothetical protein [Pseudomonas sp.]
MDLLQGLSRPAINQRFKACGHWVDPVLGGAMIVLGIKVMATQAG